MQSKVFQMPFSCSVRLSNSYKDVVLVVAVGNEANLQVVVVDDYLKSHKGTYTQFATTTFPVYCTPCLLHNQTK